MRRLAILGASGHGKVVADAALRLGWEEVVFFDDAWPETSSIGRLSVIGSTQDLLEQLCELDGVVLGIGDCKTRWQKHNLLVRNEAPVVTIIHPDASVSPYANIGVGSVVLGGAVINIDATLGAACIINTGATVDHDCALSDAVHVAPGAHLSGDVVVGRSSWIGVGAAVKEGVSIGANVMVGAGAVVIRSVADSSTFVGNPAARI